MQEMHAIANGDGTYQVIFIAAFRDGLRQYAVPDAIIKMDNIVADETGRQTVRFVVNGREVPPTEQ